MRRVKKITVIERFVGGHEGAIARAAGVTGLGASAAGCGALAIAGIAMPPLFFAALGGIVLAGIAAGAKKGQRIDKEEIATRDVSEKEWRRIPEVNKVIQEAIEAGIRKGYLTIEYETNRLSSMQRRLGGRGWVAKQYFYKIKYA